ncbi:MAG: 30S ribosomal protein S16 [Microbacteriaceae bacterium]
MAVKIKLARYGKIRQPFYRVVVADSRTRRNGRAIELVGKYQPKLEPSLIEIESDRVQYWLGVGAQPTESVVALLKVTGDWQKFKGLPGAEGTLKPQPVKVDKRTLYEAALAAIGGNDSAAATPAKKKTTKAAAKPEKAETAEKSEKSEKSETVEKADKAEVAAEASVVEAPAAEAAPEAAEAAEAPAADES